MPQGSVLAALLLHGLVLRTLGAPPSSPDPPRLLGHGAPLGAPSLWGGSASGMPQVGSHAGSRAPGTPGRREAGPVLLPGTGPAGLAAARCPAPAVFTAGSCSSLEQNHLMQPERFWQGERWGAEPPDSDGPDNSRQGRSQQEATRKSSLELPLRCWEKAESASDPRPSSLGGHRLPPAARVLPGRWAVPGEPVALLCEPGAGMWDWLSRAGSQCCPGPPVWGTVRSVPTCSPPVLRRCPWGTCAPKSASCPARGLFCSSSSQTKGDIHE